jgi:hypothetical protein
MRPLIEPVPNLNGNSKRDLQLKAADIRATVRFLLDAIQAGHDLWHGRNFQTVPDGTTVQRLAQEGWHERVSWLIEFDREVEMIMRGMDRGKDHEVDFQYHRMGYD